MSEIKPIDSAPRDGSEILLWGDCRLSGTDPDEFSWNPSWNIAHWNGRHWDNDFDGEILKPTVWAALPPPQR